MFFVFNKQKIITYFVSLLTVLALFFVAGNLKKEEVVETSAGNEKLLPIYNVETKEKKVALTMNCAWNDSDIDKILEILKNNDVQITFFMVGDWIDKYEEQVKKIYDAGNEIANHGNNHKHVNNLSYEENVQEIKLANEKIKNITGIENKLYRTPYGEYNNTAIKAAKDSGMITIQWSLDTLDYTGLTGEEMWKRLEGKLKPGDIILSHNGTEHTADSLDMLIKNIEKEGFEIVKISDLIYKENYEININGTQIKKEK